MEITVLKPCRRGEFRTQKMKVKGQVRDFTKVMEKTWNENFRDSEKKANFINPDGINNMGRIWLNV